MSDQKILIHFQILNNHFEWKDARELELFSHLIARIISLQEEVKHLKHNLERVEGERKEAQDMLNHSEKVMA